MYVVDGPKAIHWLCKNVLKKIPHRYFVFSIPNILRRYFLYDHHLLHDLSRCAWELLKVFLQETTPERKPIPDTAVAIQTCAFLGRHAGVSLGSVESRWYPDF